MGKGQNLWKKAKKLIPGGNMLISKQPERQIPDLWPPYYKKAKGCKLIDYDGNKFTDCYMGVGPNVLGYANSSIDNAVKSAISKGNMSSLNSFEEVLLAEKLIEIDPTFSKVRFARTGGEANSIAVRIARAAKKKDFVAFSGYHGWYDWYLATNLKGKNKLKNHLLPGLEPLGVPKALRNTIFGFKYNDCDDFKRSVKNKNLAAIVIEGCRFQNPNKNFVSEINKFCKINKVCLIVDEITSGWRNTIGGVYKKFGLKPDIVIYGKGIGNGYAISCIVGKKKYLNYANESFISSTAWTERIGFVAANSTIDFFLKNNVHLKIEKNGDYLIKKWKLLSKKHGLKINFSENSALASFYFDYSSQVNSKLYKFFTDRMLDYNYLASNSIYLSYSHTKKELDSYIKVCDKVFEEVKDLINNENKIYKLKTRKESFKRLT